MNGDIDDALRAAFLEETAPLAGDVERRLLKLERDAAALGAEWRLLLGTLHSIKGNCGMIDLDRAQTLAHDLEQRVREVRGWPSDAQGQAIGEMLAAADQLRDAIGSRVDLPTAEPQVGAELDAPAPAPATGAHVRVDASRLDRLLESAGELAACHGQLQAVAGLGATRSGRRHRGASGGPPGPLTVAARRLGELQAAVMELRLLPLSTVLIRFERLIRDLCQVTGKRAGLALHGAELTVDKSVLDHLAEPLLHLVRNAMDHGIEAPRERQRAGKSEQGVISMTAETGRGMLTVTVRDDGRGLDRRRLVEAAGRRGVDATAWSDDEVFDLIFAPELSTAAQVTVLSGRGVGLDQARRVIERVGGTLRVTSEAGIGTAFVLSVPLVIAIQRVLLVAVGPETYALPFTAVVEAFRVARADTAVGERGGQTRWRDQELPLWSLGAELGVRDDRAPDPVTCVVVDGGERLVALSVDRLAGHQELVVKQLDPVLREPRGLTGAGILSDGRVVMVIDPRAVAAEARA